MSSAVQLLAGHFQMVDYISFSVHLELDILDETLKLCILVGCVCTLH